MIKPFSFFPSVRTTLLAGLTLAISAATLTAQDAAVPPASATIPPATQTAPPATQTVTTQTVDQNGKPVTSTTTTKTFNRGRRKKDEDGQKIVQSKDTKKAMKSQVKADALIGADSRLPDKQLYDKAVAATKKGRYDIARLDLQTMLNTYPDSQYQMRAKLAIADSWYKEGGTAALTQAESEYADFRVFFPNAPEAAEAQMRIGDIYFRQMDKPDRDFSKTLHAEEEYRRMLTDYPDSTLVPGAKQRLREVQEVMASREADIASYYATRENWPAVIARDQTVVDTYPLYSHLDDVLISMGDAYEAQARIFRNAPGIPEGMKAQLERTYDTQAANAYRKVVTEHAAAPHVEDARDRLAAMNLPIPEPTPEQLAASTALENSRSQYKLQDRVGVLLLHRPDVITAARIGEPPMVNARATTAPMVVKRETAEFNAAMPGAKPLDTAATTAVAPATTPDAAAAIAAPTAASAPLAFTEVGTDGAAAAAPANGTDFNAAPSTSSTVSTGAGGRTAGMEIINAASPSTLPAATGTPDPNNGLKAVGPKNAVALPEREAVADAPDRPNEIQPGTSTPAAQKAPANGKGLKPAFDKSDESSSKHKKKKGLKKIVEPL